jgi:hypothetical protein
MAVRKQCPTQQHVSATTHTHTNVGCKTKNHCLVCVAKADNFKVNDDGSVTDAKNGFVLRATGVKDQIVLLKVSCVCHVCYICVCCVCVIFIDIVT